MKYIYNTSEIYTLLFKAGNLEIKPLSYYVAQEFELPIFDQAKASGQVQIYSNLSNIPSEKKKEVEVVSTAPIHEGMTEEQLKEFMLKKAAEENEKSNSSNKGSVTAFGQTKTLTEEEDKKEKITEVKSEEDKDPEPVRRGRKPTPTASNT